MVSVATKIASVESLICSLETQRDHAELYHYTPALDGILGSQTLWCSHYRDMVDGAEVTLMRAPLAEAVAPRLEAIAATMNRHRRRLWARAGGGTKTARDLVNSLYAATFDGNAVYSAMEAYLFSFSTHSADSDFERENGVRSQWEAYAGSAGHCLVFDIAEVVRMLMQETEARYWAHLTLAPVRYDDQPIERLFPELVRDLANTLREFIDGNQKPEFPSLDFLTGTTLLKGSGYRSEREVRIVAIPGTSKMAKLAEKEYPNEFSKNAPLPVLRSRTSAVGETKRYVALFGDLGLTLPIKRIIVGPGEGQEERAARARSLVNGVPVSLSMA